MGVLIEFAYRGPTEMYAFCYQWPGSLPRRTYLINPIGATASVDATAAWNNFDKSLIYWPSDDTVWAGNSLTKVWIKDLCICRKPCTHFFLA